MAANDLDDPDDPRISPWYREHLLQKRAERAAGATAPRREPVWLSRPLDTALRAWYQMSEDEKAEFMGRTGIWVHCSENVQDAP